MPTYIYNKEEFIEFLQKGLKETDVVVFTSEMTGSVSISKKNGLKVSHVFAHDVFKDEGIGHLAFGKTISISIMIADKERLSDISKKALKS